MRDTTKRALDVIDHKYQNCTQCTNSTFPMCIPESDMLQMFFMFLSFHNLKFEQDCLLFYHHSSISSDPHMYFWFINQSPRKIDRIDKKKIVGLADTRRKGNDSRKEPKGFMLNYSGGMQAKKKWSRFFVTRDVSCILLINNYSNRIMTLTVTKGQRTHKNLQKLYAPYKDN